MGDYHDVATIKSINSDIVRVYPGAVIEIYTAGTSSLITSVTADSNGLWSVSSLATGKYDLKVDGQLVKTIHHVKYNHTHESDITFTFFKSGSITGDQEPGDTIPTFGIDTAGTIIKVIVTANHVDATGNVTVHLCKKASGGASTLTMALDSVWSHAINVVSEEYGYLYQDNSPSISVSADDIIALGLDYTATTVEGVAVTIIYRPS
jgi:hypothetical protein